MSWSDDCEVAVVERGDLGQLVAFGDGDDRGVNEAESEVGWPSQESRKTNVIGVVPAPTDVHLRGWLDVG